MDNLINIYISAFSWLGNYLSGIINSFIHEPVLLPHGYWTDFLFLGFTDLATYLTFIINITIFVFIHVLFYKGFKKLFNIFRGLFY